MHANHPTSMPAEGARADRAVRPAVSVVVPFTGSADDGAALMEALCVLEVGADDEIIVADNSPAGVLAHVERPASVLVVPAVGEGSPARARNAGALAARGEWILFVDSDCRPAPDLIDRYFTVMPDDRVGIVAGEIFDAPGQPGAPAEWAATRGMMDQRTGLDTTPLPFVLTANVLIRRVLWRQLGGFLEGIFNGEDVDFCWRAQRAGWTIDFRPEASVEHVHRQSVRGLVKQAATRRASGVWVRARWPESAAGRAFPVRDMPRHIAGAAFFFVTGRVRRAQLKVLDALVVAAVAGAAYKHNRAREREPEIAATRRPVEIWCDEFPVLSETFVVNEARELQALGHDVTVVAWRRPQRPALGVHDVAARWLEDETTAERAAAVLRLAVRRPGAVIADLVGRRRWRREERVLPLRSLAPRIMRLIDQPDAHVHAHFAAGAGLNAMRAARVAKRPWSLTAHAYDIYLLPRNLHEKVRAADFVTSGCIYTVNDLREIAGPDHASSVHEIVMGVHPERFARRSPHVPGGEVVGVGRLVAKKGFDHLVRAAAEPILDGLLERLVLIGDGPDREALQAQADALGLGNRFVLAGRLEPDEIRDRLEHAALLAMPCVVAPDGDRDSMPVVVKEAMAMEVPVVVTDEVGLPELVTTQTGRVVPPGDHVALAAALAELLALDVDERAELGRAGRARIAEMADVRKETAKLSELIERAARPV